MNVTLKELLEFTERISMILKKRFPNLTVEETQKLANEITLAFNEHINIIK